MCFSRTEQLTETETPQENYDHKNVFISWNCRGIKNKKQDLEILIKEKNPISISLQELKMKNDPFFELSNYSFVYKNLKLEPDEIAHGGVGTFIRKDTPFTLLNINSIFQTVTIQISLPKKITICNIYIHERTKFSERNLKNLINQLPRPFILTGDFNSHNPIWFDNKLDERGKIIEKFILENNISLLDENKFTYTNSKTQSHIDLTLVTPDLCREFYWDTYDCLCNSDHLPILIESFEKYPSEEKKRWNFEKANWTRFKLLANFEKPISDFRNIDKLYQYIVDTIKSAAEKSIPVTKTIKNKKSVPWWNGCCRVAVKNKKAAFKKYRKNPTLANFIFYKKMNAEAKKVVKKSKKDSWISFLATISPQSSIKEVWSKIGSLKRKKKPHISTLKINDNIVDDPKEIANALAKSLSNVSSFKKKSENFIKHKNDTEKEINFDSQIYEAYNSPISFHEIRDILQNSNDSATGEDEVHYFMLKNLSDDNLMYIKHFFNLIFLKHLFPKKWQDTLVIPILKPDKDPQDPLSYRPISLISCIYKLLDKIINNRLVWFLEKNNFLSNSQNGGRKGRSTMDNVASLVSEISHSFVHQKYHVTIFLDLEKAYDTCWKFHILQELKKFKMHGNLPIFVKNFLENRTVHVNAGKEKSDHFPLDMGIPQGSALSGTLFLIAINPILSKLSPQVYKSLFIDDCRISVSAYDLQSAKTNLQFALNQLQNWCCKTGFSFSAKKSKVLIFHKKRRTMEPKIELFLNDKKLDCVKEFKFLGVIFDQKLSWLPHFTMLKQEVNNRLKILKIVTNSKFNTNNKILLNIYKSLILPKLEYGSVAYHTAPPTTLAMLDPLHHQGLRICLKAFRTTPFESLYVESGIPSLQNRRKLSCCQFYFRCLEYPNNYCNKILLNTNSDAKFRNKKHGPFPPGMIIRKYLSDLNVGTPKIITKNQNPFPYWLMPKIQVCTDLTFYPKSATSTDVLKQRFLDHKHTSDLEIYTDGSKTTTGTGAGVAIFVSRSNTCIQIDSKLNKLASIFTAELEGLKIALKSVSRQKNKNVCIYCDSISALQAIQKLNPPNETIREIHRLIFLATQNKNKINFCWSPGHCDIFGNELADTNAKKAANDQTFCLKAVSASDIKPHIKKQSFIFWKSHWENLSDNKKLRDTGTTVETIKYFTFSSRADEIKFTRLRLGHTRLTHEFIFKNTPPPICNECRVPFTIEHILLVCPRYYQERLNNFGNQILTLEILLNRKNFQYTRNVLQFLKDSNLYTDI